MNDKILLSLDNLGRVVINDKTLQKKISGAFDQLAYIYDPDSYLDLVAKGDNRLIGSNTLCPCPPRNDPCPNLNCPC